MIAAADPLPLLALLHAAMACAMVTLELVNGGAFWLHLGAALLFSLMSWSMKSCTLCTPIVAPGGGAPKSVCVWNLSDPALNFFFGTLVGLKLNVTVELFPSVAASAMPVTARAPAAATARMTADRLLMRMGNSLLCVRLRARLSPGRAWLPI